MVLEHFQTDTADHADILLPATTQLEHLDVVRPYGHYYLVANNPAIRPLGEAKPNTEIFRLLAARHGIHRALLRGVRSRDRAVPPWPRIGISTRYGSKAGNASAAPRGMARFANGDFPTPSGKVEFHSDAAVALGLDPLPDYIPPLEDTRGDLARRFPLAMISPPARHFLNSSFVNVASLRAVEGEPWLDIHPHDAQQRGSSTAATCACSTTAGSLELRARVSDRARPGVVVALSVWWKKLTRDGKNANELTESDALTDMGVGRFSTIAWSRWRRPARSTRETPQEARWSRAGMHV